MAQRWCRLNDGVRARVLTEMRSQTIFVVAVLDTSLQQKEEQDASPNGRFAEADFVETEDQ